MTASLARVRTRTRPLAQAALTQTVTPLAPGAPTAGTYGQPVPGAPVAGTPVLASVTPETPQEHLGNDRPQSETAYTVRVARTAQTAAWTAQHALRWERSAARGGPLVLAIVGTPAEDHGRGRFLDIPALHTAPATAPEA